MPPSPFNFGLSPEKQTQQQQVFSPSQSANNPEGFALLPFGNASPHNTAREEGSGMAFLFGESKGGGEETGGDGGIGLFQFEGSEEHSAPVDDCTHLIQIWINLCKV